MNEYRCGLGVALVGLVWSVAAVGVLAGAEIAHRIFGRSAQTIRR